MPLAPRREIDVPEWRRRARVVGVKRIDAVVHRGDIKDVSDARIGNRHVWYVEWLGVDVVVDRAGKELAKRCRVDV